MIVIRPGFSGYTSLAAKKPVFPETDQTIPQFSADHFKPQFGMAAAEEASSAFRRAAKSYLDGRKAVLKSELKKALDVKYVVLWRKYEARLTELRDSLKDLRQEEKEARAEAKEAGSRAAQALKEELDSLMAEVNKWKTAVKTRTEAWAKTAPNSSARKDAQSKLDEAKRELSKAESDHKKRKDKGTTGEHHNDAQEALKRAKEISRKIEQGDRDLARLLQFRMQTSIPQTIVDNAFSKFWVGIGEKLTKIPVPLIRNAGESLKDKGEAQARQILKEGLNDAQDIAEAEIRKIRASLRNLGIRA